MIEKRFNPGEKMGEKYIETPSLQIKHNSRDVNYFTFGDIPYRCTGI